MAITLTPLLLDDAFYSISESILSLLDVKSLLTCASTCTRLNDIVTGSSRLQLQLRAAYHGWSDGYVRLAPGDSAHARLERLLDIERRWTMLDPKRIEAIDVAELTGLPRQRVRYMTSSDGLLVVATSEAVPNGDENYDTWGPPNVLTVLDVTESRDVGVLQVPRKTLCGPEMPVFTVVYANRDDNLLAVVTPPHNIWAGEGYRDSEGRVRRTACLHTFDLGLDPTWVVSTNDNAVPHQSIEFIPKELSPHYFQSPWVWVQRVEDGIIDIARWEINPTRVNPRKLRDGYDIPGGPFPRINWRAGKLIDTTTHSSVHREVAAPSDSSDDHDIVPKVIWGYPSGEGLTSNVGRGNHNQKPSSKTKERSSQTPRPRERATIELLAVWARKDGKWQGIVVDDVRFAPGPLGMRTPRSPLPSVSPHMPPTATGADDLTLTAPWTDRLPFRRNGNPERVVRRALKWQKGIGDETWVDDSHFAFYSYMTDTLVVLSF